MWMQAAGTSGLVCIAGAALDQRVRSLLLNRSLADLESVVASKDYDLPLSAVAFGFLRNFDLPELCASVAPRPIWLLNSVGPNGELLSLSEISDSYQVTMRAYGQNKKVENFCLRVEPAAADEVALAWMQKVLA
jgi:hypothetical protein